MTDADPNLAETPSSTKETWTQVVEKIVFLFVLCIGYLMIERWEAAEHLTFHQLYTPLDRWIPFRVGWVHIYVSLFALMITPFLWATNRSYYRRLFTAYAATLVVAYLIFLVFPTMIDRPDTQGMTGFNVYVYRLMIGVDAATNCFPSLHVGLSVLTALCLLPLHRLLGIAFVLWALGIAASTLFLDQHFVADVLAGAALATTAWYLTIGRRLPAAPADFRNHRSGWILLIPVLLQAAMVLGFYVTYLRE